MDLKKFKYTADFEVKASFDFGKWKQAKANQQAFASLEDLRSLLPDDAEIADNPDLLYTSFNAAVVNLVNANGHAIGTDTALAVSKYFVNRQTNVEHSRWDIIGHIITQGFSTFGENKIIKPDKLVGTNEPFNISLGAVVYKIAREWMAEIIKESADKTSDYHEYISASWEIGFDEFDIILGSKKVSDATIISDPEKIEEYTQYLQMSGGDGFLPDGTPVYCLIKGDARPLGIGFTSNPAAAVKGVFVPEAEEEKEDPKRDEGKASEKPVSPEELADQVAKILENRVSVAANLEKEKNLIENNSQTKKNTVITNMKLKSVNDLTPEFLQTAEASKEVRDFIAEALKTASDEHTEKLDAVTKEKESFETSEKETKATLEKVQKELQELQEQVQAKAKQEAFNVRMDEIANEYELDEKQSKAIASQIKELTDESYKSWKDEFLVPFGKKKAAASEEKPKDDEVEVDATKAVQIAVASTDSTPPPNSLSSEKDEFAKMVEGLTGLVSIRI